MHAKKYLATELIFTQGWYKIPQDFRKTKEILSEKKPPTEVTFGFLLTIQ